MCIAKKARLMSNKEMSEPVSEKITPSQITPETPIVVEEKIEAPIRSVRINQLLVPKGLPNLGNTCFYNSAIQCILNTHHFEFYAEKVGKEFEVCVPECSCAVYDNKIDVAAAKIPVTFKKSTVFIDTFKKFLTEFYSDRSPNPRPVFEQVAQRAPRFRGWHQQDSHELLRYFIDGLRQEELDAINISVIKYLRAQGHTENLNLIKRAYMNFAKPAVDCVFSGSLLQIICCSECKHESICFEPFLDLSLSIPRNISSNNSSKQDKFLSKNQLKKQKKGKKKNKKGKRQGTSGKNDTVEAVEALESKAENGSVAIDENEDGADRNSKSSAEPREPNEVQNSDELSDSSSGSVSSHLLLSAKSEEFASSLSSLKIVEGKTIEYALSCFTRVEFLHDKNGYECEKCCVPVNKEKGKRHKIVNAQKRYFIQSLPPILTLHLKRFEKTQQFNRVYTNKVSDHIEFPLILDIAPYSSKRAEPMSKGQKKILYSLYGIVCHSGSLNGGHYIAYVRSRKPPSQIEKFFKQASFFDASSLGDFVQYQKIQSETTVKEHLEVESLSEEEALATLSASSWYYCSDSHIQRVSEERALSAEAFMLFYERFY